MIKYYLQEKREVLKWLLNKVTNYNLVVLTEKVKSMAFSAEYQIRSKMKVNGKLVEQVRNFNYVGCDISHNYDQPGVKIHRF
jgi:IS30 family transposase